MIQVLHRAFDILELLAKDPERVFGLSEIAGQLDLNSATCANILKTIVSRNYIEQTGTKKGYRLGAMAFHLTGSQSYHQDLVHAAQKAMEKLSREINETSILSILRNNKRVVIHQVEGQQDLNVRTNIEKDIYATATGRLLLAHHDHIEREAIVKKIGLPDTSGFNAADLLDFQQKMDDLKNQNMLIMTTQKHIVGLATPILRNNKVVASLGIYLPEIRFEGVHKKRIIDGLIKTTENINQKIKKLIK